MTTETITIRINEDGSRVVRRNIQDIGETSKKAADGVDFLKRALAALGAFLAVDKVRQYADAWNAAAGQIRIATKNTAEAAAVTEGLFKAAQNTRQPFEDLVELYTRAARAGKSLAASQQDIIDFTEDIGKSLAVQGTTAEKAKGALLQLGQALGSGVVRAEEFNSILEGAPYILQVVANNIKGVDGNIATLRKKMLDGELTSKAFFDAFKKGSGDIEKDFAKSSLTISQGLTVINNALMRYIGELDTSLGLSQKFGEAAKFIAKNIDGIATALLAIAAAAAVAFAPGLLASFAAGVRSLFMLIAAHPFGALAAAIAAAAVVLYKYRDAITVGIDETTKLTDLLQAFGEYAVQAFDNLYLMASQAFTGIADLVQSAYNAITSSTSDATTEWMSDYTGFYSDVGSGFAGLVRGIAKTLDAIGGLLTGLGIAIVRVFEGIPEAVTTPFRLMYNVAVEWVEKIINTVIDGVNRVRGFVGASLLENIKIDRADADPAYYEKYGQTIADSIAAGFEAQGGALLNEVNGIFDRAQQIAQERKVIEGFGANQADLTKPVGGATKSALDPKELEKARKALQSLLSQVDPAAAAIMEMQQAWKTLDDAVKMGLISDEKRLQYLSKLYEQLNDVMDPLGAYNRELDIQTRLLGMSARAREVEIQFLQIQQDLLSKGKTLNAEESAALRKRLADMQRLNEVVAAQDQLMSETVEKRRAFYTQLNAIQALLADPTSGFSKEDATEVIVRQNEELFKGTQASLDAQSEAYRLMYEQIAAYREADLINEDDANRMRLKLQISANQQMYDDTNTFLGNLTSLSKSGNTKLAEVGKAAAVAQATMYGVLSVQKALAEVPYPYNYAVAASAAVTAAMNVAEILNTKTGFKTGGYTGNGGVDEVAGVVHGREFVMNAQATAANRPALEAMNRGDSMAVGAPGVNVNIQNYGTSKQFEVQQLSREEIRIIARDEARSVTPEVMSQQLQDPNSRPSKTLKQRTVGGARNY